MRPSADFRAIGVNLAVNFIANKIFADQAWHQAAPAAVRVDIPGAGIEQDVLFARVDSFAYHFQ